ncbi:hypothetical protein RQM47_12585 [Rubrivirga sp. S365]|uniref:ParE-like toxin domain-containing protein n=1 Tax=Rubrivirga litoralis TaxID=3075598 RepID=A0ABU3BU24_9BACT|nr:MULTISPECIES: hypothetical protein [unclassified Rubrivirga]MDT0632792.1 hypothetical protein [Rubrivirga sp. F394]MDT7857482.1 hypothetical protein [Rubrivirga sp. S365]
MTFDFTKGYLKRLQKLPGHVQTRTLKALDRLDQDERYPSLHFKRVSEEEGAWSVRVSQDYRMVGYRQDDHVTWFWIGKHDDYDKLLDRLG